MQVWAARSLDEIYAAIGVTLAGEKDVLACGPAPAGRGEVLDERANRPEEPGIRDVFFVVSDALKGLPHVVSNVVLPHVVSNVWPQAIAQTLHRAMIRNTFRLPSRRDWNAVKRT